MLKKIFIGFGVLIGCVILCAVVIMLLVSSTNGQKGSNEEKLQASGQALGQAPRDLSALCFGGLR